MSQNNSWLLPDGVDEFLPPKAEALESLRRELLDLYSSWGYQLVVPPLIEYLDSLLNGAGKDLELETVKVTDQLTGKMMGVRADITPQVARMDAHSFKSDAANRLCYASTVLRTRPQGLAGSRIPYQIGLEFFGQQSIQSDIETISLMVESLKVAACQNVTLDIGHVAIFKALCAWAELSDVQQQELGDIYQRKALAELEVFCESFDKKVQDALLGLASLSGDQAVLVKARKLFDGEAFSVVHQALDDLQQIADHICDAYPDVQFYFDLSELRGYAYHTGCVFSAYVEGDDKPCVYGGRYDQIGENFGRNRPATGFSADLKKLVLLGQCRQVNPTAIWAPMIEGDKELITKQRQAIAELRKNGERVIQQVAQNEKPLPICDRLLVVTSDKTETQPL